MTKRKAQSKASKDSGYTLRVDPRPRCIKCSKRWVPGEGIDATNTCCGTCTSSEQADITIDFTKKLPDVFFEQKQDAAERVACQWFSRGHGMGWDEDDWRDEIAALLRAFKLHGDRT